MKVDRGPILAALIAVALSLTACIGTNNPTQPEDLPTDIGVPGATATWEPPILPEW